MSSMGAVPVGDSIIDGNDFIGEGMPMPLSIDRSLLAVTLVVASGLAGVDVLHGAPDPEALCQKGRYAAWAKYAACEAKTLAKVGGIFPDAEKLAKCRTKHAASWSKLQAKAAGSGSTCDNPRYDTTSAPGTVVDRLTGLQWTQSTDDGGVLDKDNAYLWGVTLTGADGPLFTTFLATLTGGCFAGQCDWRIPTRAELQTILSDAYPCPTPCIDQAVFGTTNAIWAHWASTSSAVDPNEAWYVNAFGEVGATLKSVASTSGRAVRGGL
jgi:hypothetical protein